MKQKNKRRGCLFYLLYLTIFTALVMICYSFLVSSFFYTSIVFPLSSWGTDWEVSAGEVRLSLLNSSLVIEDLKVADDDGTMKFVCKKYSGRFFLRSLFSRKLQFNDVLLQDSTLDWTYPPRIAEARKSAEAPRTPVSESIEDEQEKAPAALPVAETEKPKVEKSARIFWDLRLKNIKLENFNFNFTYGSPDNPGKVSLRGLDFTLPQFANGARSNFLLNCDVAMREPWHNIERHGVMNFSSSIQLGEHYELDSLESRLQLLFADQKQQILMEMALSCTDGVYHLGKAEFREEKNGVLASRGKLTGEWNRNDTSCRFDLAELELGEQMAAFASELFLGRNYGAIKLNAAGSYQYRDAVSTLIGKAALCRGGDELFPETRLTADVNGAYAHLPGTLELNAASVCMTDSRERLALLLKKPLTLALSGGEIENSPGELQLAGDEFDLRWIDYLFLKDYQIGISKGLVSGSVRGSLLPNLRGMDFDGTLRSPELEWGPRSAPLMNFGAELTGQGEYRWLGNQLLIDSMAMTVKHGKEAVGDLTLAGRYDFSEWRGKLILGGSSLSTKVSRIFPAALDLEKKLGMLDGIQGSFELGLSMKGGLAGIDRGDAELFLDNARVVDLHTGKIRVDLSSLNNTEPFLITGKIARFPVAKFNYLQKESPLYCDSGFLSGSLSLRVQPEYDIVSIDSALELTDTLLQYRNQNELANRLTVLQSMEAELRHLREFELKKSRLQFILDGRKIAVGSLRGVVNQDGLLSDFSATLDEMHADFLNLFWPGRFAEADLTGSATLHGEDHFRYFTLNGELKADRLLLRDGGKSLNGAASLAIVREEGEYPFLTDSRVKLESDGQVALALRLNELPRIEGERSYELSSRKIDVEMLLQFLLAAATNGAPQGEVVEEALPDAPPETVAAGGVATPKVVALPAVSPPPSRSFFDFGSMPLLLHTRLANITYGSYNRCDINGVIRFQDDSIRASELEVDLNGGLILTGFILDGTTDGVRFETWGNNQTALKLPIVQPLDNSTLKEMKGDLLRFQWKLAGILGDKVRFWDSLRGFSEGEIVDFEIPNEFGNRLVGRLMLLPFAVISQVEELIPGRSSGWGKVFSVVDDFSQKLSFIAFERGRFRISSREGTIRIDEFDFQGDLIDHFQFAGEMRLGSRPGLALRSIVTIAGMKMPTNIEGTLEDPYVDIKATMARFVGNNVSTVIDSLSGLIQLKK